MFWIRIDIALVLWRRSFFLFFSSWYIMVFTCFFALVITHIKKYIYIEQRADRIKKEDTRPNCHESNVFMAGD